MSRSLSCANCAAPLEIPEGVRYVTCEFCQSRLQVRQSGGTFYTELMEKLDRRSQAMQRDLESLRRGRDIDRLDRAWEREQEEFMNESKTKLMIPQMWALVTVAVVCGGVGLICLIQSVVQGGNLTGFLAGGFFILSGIFVPLVQYQKRRSFFEAKQAYLDKRRRLGG